jgi:hypothetical protein
MNEEIIGVIDSSQQKSHLSLKFKLPENFSKLKKFQREIVVMARGYKELKYDWQEIEINIKHHEGLQWNVIAINGKPAGTSQRMYEFNETNN